MPNRRTDRSRGLRRLSTDAEHALWRVLRRKSFSGLKFRRQHPIGPYVTDFACPEAKLVIELDGGQHAEREMADVARTAFLEARGYRVIRFWNNDVLSNLDGVTEWIEEVLKEV